jgi:hypothetical protein
MEWCHVYVFNNMLLGSSWCLNTFGVECIFNVTVNDISHSTKNILGCPFDFIHRGKTNYSGSTNRKCTSL